MNCKISRSDFIVFKNSPASRSIIFPPLSRALHASSRSLLYILYGHGVVSRSALGKQKVYYPRVSAEAEDVRYTIQGFRVLIKNDFEV